jgi:hypothetical protein
MNKYLTVGILLVVIVLVIVFREKLTALFSPKTPATPQPTPGTGAPAPAALNLTLLLKKGSTGEEVKVLQGYLGVTADGQFGPITENALLAKKGIREVTLANYNQLPDAITIDEDGTDAGYSSNPLTWFF